MRTPRNPFFVLCALGTLLGFSFAFGAETVTIACVKPQHMPRTDFQRISEYFTYRENPGRRVILRTQPQEREGMYFVITLNKKASALPSGSQVKLQVITSESPKAQTFNLPFPEQVGGYCEVFAGLTGSDWSSKKIDLVAWKVILEDGSGEALAEEQSFIWEFPPSEQPLEEG